MNFGFPSKAAATLLFSLLVACTDRTAPRAEPDGGPLGDGGRTDDGGSSSDGGGGGDAKAPSSVAFKIASYPMDGGKLFLVPVSVNGSAPFDVLLDTGSDGLRVFQEALHGTAVDVGTKAITAEFGGGDVMAGHVASAPLSFGDVNSAAPVAFHLVESFECSASTPNCDFAGGNTSIFTDVGIHGILGVSGRVGDPIEVYTPFAQLAPELSRGFVIHTGGFNANAGEISFDVSKAALQGFAVAPLKPDGKHANGTPAWADDQIDVCFAVQGKPLAPACVPSAFDTGSSADIIYGPMLAAADVEGGALAPGVAFEATLAPALDLKLTVGATPMASLDLVFVDTSFPFAILGVGVFLRQDVLFDFSGGNIGFRPNVASP